MDWFFALPEPEDKDELDAMESSDDDDSDDESAGSGGAAAAAGDGSGHKESDEEDEENEEGEKDKLYGFITTVEKATEALTASAMSAKTLKSVSQGKKVTIDVDNMPGPDEKLWQALFLLLKKNENVRSVSFFECGGIDEDAGLFLGDLLRWSDTLRILSLDGTALQDEGAKWLAAGLSMGSASLRVLTIKRSGLSDEGATHIGKALAEARCPRLHTVNVAENAVGDAGCDALGKATKAKGSKIRELNLSTNLLSDYGAAHLADALKFNKAMRTLNVSGSKLGKRAFAVLTMAAKANSKLEAVVIDSTAAQEGARRRLNHSIESEPVIRRDAEDGTVEREYDNGDVFRAGKWRAGNMKGVLSLNIANVLEPGELNVLVMCVVSSFVLFGLYVFMGFQLLAEGNLGGGILSFSTLGVSTVSSMYVLGSYGSGRQAAVELQLLHLGGLPDLIALLGKAYIDNVAVDPNDDAPILGARAIYWLSLRQSLIESAPHALMLLCFGLRWAAPEPALVLIVTIVLAFASFAFGLVVSDRQAIKLIAQRRGVDDGLSWTLKEGDDSDDDDVEGDDADDDAKDDAAKGDDANGDDAGVGGVAAGEETYDEELGSGAQLAAVDSAGGRVEAQVEDGQLPSVARWSDNGVLLGGRLLEVTTHIIALALLATNFELLFAAAFGIEVFVAWVCLGAPLSLYAAPVALYAALCFPGVEATTPVWLSDLRVSFAPEFKGIVAIRLLATRVVEDAIMIVVAVAAPGNTGFMWGNPLFSQAAFGAGAVGLILVGVRAYTMSAYIDRLAAMSHRLDAEDAEGLLLNGTPLWRKVLGLAPGKVVPEGGATDGGEEGGDDDEASDGGGGEDAHRQHGEPSEAHVHTADAAAPDAVGDGGAAAAAEESAQVEHDHAYVAPSAEGGEGAAPAAGAAYTVDAADPSDGWWWGADTTAATEEQQWQQDGTDAEWGAAGDHAYAAAGEAGDGDGAAVEAGPDAAAYAGTAGVDGVDGAPANGQVWQTEWEDPAAAVG